MADETKIVWNGRDLAEALANFRDDVSNKTVKRALRDVAKLALGMLQAAAPHRTGRLESNLGVRARRGGQGTVGVDVVVSTRGGRDDANNAFYWRFLEFGHKTRPNKAGVSRREIPPINFIRNLWLRLQSTIANSFFTALDRAVDKTYTREGK